MGNQVKTLRALIVVLAIAVPAISHASNKNTAEEKGPARLSRNVPHPVSNPQSTLMLVGDWVPEDPQQIDFDNLPRTPSEHAVVSDVRGEGGKRVNQHAYLVRHDGLFWAMWSDGPGVSRGHGRVPGHDLPGQRVSFATSNDGLNWCDARDLSGPPKKGFGYIARGFWERDGELLALASHFNAPGYRGKGLSLEAFRWDRAVKRWESAGTVQDDAMNNFPPKRLPSGEWMMSRRDHQGQVTVMVGGVKTIDQWKIMPLSYGGKQRPEEPYWYVLPDGKNLVGLFRDNSGSKRLLRAFSTDNGRSWSKLVRTNFPDATSKFNALRTSRGYYVLVSNPNPSRRDPLALSVGPDGLVYTKMFYLVGGRHIDYPHVIEHDGSLFIAFSGAKQTVEVLKVPLEAVDALLEENDGQQTAEQPNEVGEKATSEFFTNSLGMEYGDGPLLSRAPSAWETKGKSITMKSRRTQYMHAIAAKARANRRWSRPSIGVGRDTQPRGVYHTALLHGRHAVPHRRRYDSLAFFGNALRPQSGLAEGQLASV